MPLCGVIELVMQLLVHHASRSMATVAIPHSHAGGLHTDVGLQDKISTTFCMHLRHGAVCRWLVSIEVCNSGAVSERDRLA